MGLKYDAHQFKRAGNRLNNSQKAFKRYLIRDMEKLARLVERLSRAMAPLETGSLETAIFARVIKEGYSGLRIELSVSGAKPRQGHPGVEVGDYAKYMELGKYRLGYLSRMKMNRPGFPGECFICELRLPDHRFRWKYNKLFLLLPEEYGPAFPAIVDCYTSPPT